METCNMCCDSEARKALIFQCKLLPPHFAAFIPRKIDRENCRPTNCQGREDLWSYIVEPVRKQGWSLGNRCTFPYLMPTFRISTHTYRHIQINHETFTGCPRYIRRFQQYPP